MSSVGTDAHGPEHSQRYGVPIVKEDLDDGLLRITGLVEKPKPEDAPSSYAAIGGYVVTPGVVDELREQTKRWYDHKTGEVYLSDAINAYAKGEPSTDRSFRATGTTPETRPTIWSPSSHPRWLTPASGQCYDGSSGRSTAPIPTAHSLRCTD